MNSLCKWSQHKFPLRNANVRDTEPLIMHLLIAVEEDIQINVSWSFINHLYPPHLPLNGLQCVKESKWLELGLDLDIP